MAVIRATDGHQSSDQLVRYLSVLAKDDPDAATVLLEALAWTVRVHSNRRLSSEFRDDILVELSLVVLEADDLHELDNLPSRLVRRAHARAGRRHRAAVETRARESQVSPEDRRLVSPTDVAQIATDRVLLIATLELIREHIDAGRLPERSWEDCRDGCLAPALGLMRLQRDRSRTYRGRKAVKAVLVHAL